MNEEAQLKNWYKFAKLHKAVPSQFKDSGQYESQYYSVNLAQICGLAYSPQMCLRILVNLYNTETKEFFGRTYESPFIDVQPHDDSYTHPNMKAYFHLKHGPQAPIALIIEVLQFEKKEEVVVSRQTVGWGQMNFQLGEQLKITLRKGSARLLLTQQTTYETSPYYCILDVAECPEVKSLQQLIPDGALCGYGDEVLGIFGVILDEPFQTEFEETVYLCNAQVVMPLSIDLLINEHVRKYRSVKFRDDTKALIEITNRKLIIGFHNGWTMTNRKQMGNFISLDEGQKVDDNNKKMTFNGSLEISNVYRNQKGVLIMQLEYDIQFTVQNIGRQFLNLVLGWCPMALKDQFSEQLILGPGRTLSGRQMVDLENQEMPIVVSGQIKFEDNYNPIPQKSLSQIPQMSQVKTINNVQTLNNVQTINNMQPDSQLDNSQLMNVKDDKMKLKILENTLKQLQAERQMSATAVATDFENKLRMDKQKEIEYQHMVEEMRRQHEEEISKIQEQYDTLKKMLTDLNVTQQQYMVKAQPTASMALLQNSALYDQQDLEKWKIIESMTSVPRKTFYKQQQELLVEAQFGSKNLSRGDMAFLTQNGIRQLFDQNFVINENEDLKTRSLEFELRDEKQASKILIQVLCLRPRVTQTSENLEPIFNYYSHDTRIPTRVQLTINFFDFSLYDTELLVFENGFDKNSFQLCLAQSIPLLFIREQFLQTGNDHKEPVFVLDVEPSQQAHTYPSFCEYLYHKVLNIEIWDADSRQIFGTAKLPMRSLMRQGNDSAAVMKKLDIIAPEFKRIKGELHLLVKNIGRRDNVHEFKDSHGKVTKRKVISTQKLTVQSIKEQEGQDLIRQNPDERIQERIRRFKQQAVVSQSTNINEIIRYKEIKKNAFVRTVIQNHINDERTIYPVFGQMTVIQYEFRNQYTTGQNFIIVIDEPELRCSGISELSIVSSATEWKFLADAEKANHPPDFNMLQIVNNNTSFYLNPKEAVTLLFKYMTFREVDTSIEDIQRTDELALKQGKEWLLKNSYPRQLAFFINQTDGQAAGGLRIKVFPRPNVVDHIYRFQERDHREISLICPAMYSYSVPSGTKPRLECTQKNVAIEWHNDFEFRMSLRTTEAQQKTAFQILAYQDSYMYKQIANWTVIIDSLSGVAIEVPLGQVQQIKLTIFVEYNRQVKFFSSHPLLLWFPQPFDQSVNLLPGKINNISCAVRLLGEMPAKILITCVDQSNRDLVKSWLINVSPTVPAVSQVFDVNCPKVQPKTFKIPYTNKLSSEINLIFLSSDNDVLEVLEPKYNFKPQQKIDISVRMKRVRETDRTEVKLYVGDEDRSKDIYDCLLFRVSYV